MKGTGEKQKSTVNILFLKNGGKATYIHIIYIKCAQVN